MTDRELLLAAIRRDPWDDTPRLVLADWLEENGEPEYGDFIRVQCEIARLESDADFGHKGCVCVACGPLRRRERELLESPRYGTHGVANWVAWAGAVPAMLPPARGGLYAEAPWQFRRGFVEVAACPLETWTGGPCGRCSHDTQFRASGMCRKCIDGRTPGIAAAVAAAMPGLVEVRATDRDPDAYERDDDPGPWVWLWFGPGDGSDAARLPREVFDLLAPAGGLVSVHPTRPAALAALSAALLSLGQSPGVESWAGSGV